mgnify:CR=1 FL=1
MDIDFTYIKDQEFAKRNHVLNSVSDAEVNTSITQAEFDSKYGEGHETFTKEGINDYVTATTEGVEVVTDEIVENISKELATLDNIEDGLIGDKERDEQGIPAQLAQISAQRNLLTAKEGALLEKGLTSLNPDVILKAQGHWNDIQKREATGVKSTVMDPNEFNDSMGYKHKKNSLTFNTLRKMSHSPIIRAIITTRQAQVSAFSAPQANRFDTGFVIRKRRDYYDQGVVEISDEEMKEAKLRRGTR